MYVDRKPEIQELYLAHYGVKGMKWGVRRTPEQLGHVRKKSAYSSPEEMLKSMKKFKYEEWSPGWRLKSHDEVAKTKSGNCHDQVMFEAEELRRMGKSPKIKFMIETNGQKGGVTHSFVYYKENGKTVWLENAWGNKAGIRKYNSIDDIKKEIESDHKKNVFGDSKKFPKIAWGDFNESAIRPGENLSGLLDYIDFEDYGIFEKETHLAHHGVKGMKWGVRHDRKRTGRVRLGSKNSTSNKRDADKDDMDHDTSETVLPGVLSSLAINTATAVARSGDPIVAIPLASYTFGKLAAKHAAARIKDNKYAKEREAAKIDKKTGLKIKSKELSESEDLKRINPSYGDIRLNTKNNCMLCTMAYDLRRKGYDVAAGKASSGYDYDDVKKWYPKAKVEHGAKLKMVNNPSLAEFVKASPKDTLQYHTDVSNTINKIKQQGNGARGNIMIQWCKSEGGHSMIYEVKNGSFIMRDGQSNKTYSELSATHLLSSSTSSISYARLDNVDFDANAVRKNTR